MIAIKPANWAEGASYWIISCPTGLSLEQAQALTNFLYWTISDPQAIATARQLGYEPLPEVIRQKVIAQLAAIQVGSQRVFTPPAGDQPFTPRHFTAPVALQRNKRGLRPRTPTQPGRCDCPRHPHSRRARCQRHQVYVRI